MSDAVNFDKVLAGIKDLAELQAYADAQYKTIVKQNKKINELEEKTKSLESLATGLPQKASNVIEFPSLNISAEEEICLKQLENLRQDSATRPLTLEECRKVEIYAKILMQLRGNAKDLEGKYKKVSTEELLKLTTEPNGDVK